MSDKLKTMLVVGARPNFMKAAPLERAMERNGYFETILVHTGQHYDDNMSRVFFDELGLHLPDINFGIGSGSHAKQIAGVMVHMEEAIEEHDPELVVVFGDVNSTMATALVATRMGIPVVHVEAGLRSRDWSMPEEQNRVVTDHVADAWFTTESDASLNLIHEGLCPKFIYLAGDLMVDTLYHMMPKIIQSKATEDLGVEPGKFVVATMHRGANVDSPQILGQIMGLMGSISKDYPVVFTVHPRTKHRLVEFGYDFEGKLNGIKLVPPLGYIDFINLVRNSGAVITDSGSLQTEATLLGVPCITLRTSTERPCTLRRNGGMVHLVSPTEAQRAYKLAMKYLKGGAPKTKVPAMWDGNAADRIVEALLKIWGPSAWRALKNDFARKKEDVERDILGSCESE